MAKKPSSTPQYTEQKVSRDVTPEERSHHLESIKQTLSERLKQILSPSHSIDELIAIQETENENKITYSVELTEEGKNQLHKKGILDGINTEIKAIEAEIDTPVTFKGHSFEFSESGKQEASTKRSELESKLKNTTTDTEEKKDLRLEITKLTTVIEEKFPKKERKTLELQDLETLLTLVGSSTYHESDITRPRYKKGDTYIKTTLTELNRLLLGYSLKTQITEKEAILNPKWEQEQRKEINTKLQLALKTLPVRIGVALGVTLALGGAIKLITKNSDPQKNISESVEPKPQKPFRNFSSKEINGDISTISPERDKEMAEAKILSFINTTIVKDKNELWKKIDIFIEQYKSLFPDTPLAIKEGQIAASTIGRNIARSVENGTEDESLFLQEFEELIIRSCGGLIRERSLDRASQEVLLETIGSAIRNLSTSQKVKNKLGNKWATKIYYKTLASAGVHVNNQEFPKINFDGNSTLYIYQ